LRVLNGKYKKERNGKLYEKRNRERPPRPEDRALMLPQKANNLVAEPKSLLAKPKRLELVAKLPRATPSS
jgi:hypothetical protein